MHMPVIFDFSFVLVALALLTGLIWALDRALFQPRRGAGAREPVLTEYARSFFPIIVLVLAERTFLYEPFRIPSDSMMPTLLDGDFIFVSKFAYGLRLPVLNTKVLAIGEPERGDVVVFRKPSDPSITYIKRLVGLPGDRIQVRGDAVWVNGVAMSVRDDGTFLEDECYRNFRQGTERLGAHEHRIMYCPVEPRRYQRGCSSKRDLNECTPEHGGAGAALGPAGDRGSAPNGTWLVPTGQYFFMGDNRDNSDDSRLNLGFVPEGNLVGKAVRIWLSFGGGSGVAFGRIGMAVR